MGSPTTSYFSITGDELVDGMTTGYRWVLDSSRTLDFSISNGFYGEGWANPSYVASNFSNILSVYSYYANIKFQYAGHFNNPSDAEVGGSEINLSVDGSYLFFGGNTVWARGFFPNGALNSSYYQGVTGDIYLNINSAASILPSYSPGSQGWFLVLHETGHALGLKHPHDDGGTGRPTFNSLGIAGLDIDLMTVMSYNDNADWNSFSWDPATPMVLDVLAMQYLYGKNMATNTGNTYHDLDDVTGYYVTIWDASGSGDIVSAKTAGKGWTIILPNTIWSSLVDTKVGVALPTSDLSLSVPTTLVWLTGNVENIVGSSYADNLTGSDGANKINGGMGADILNGLNGNDVLDGGVGNDTMKGGKGGDTYVVGSSGDKITELAGQGADLVKSNISYTLGGNIEKLTLTGGNAINGVGNSLANVIVGNGASNKLTGNGSADTLKGNAGNDTLIGGAGQDVLYGGGGSDFFVFNYALGSGNIDVIKDYSAAVDTIRLENSVFTKLAATGTLKAGNFKVGSVAGDANDFIIYKKDIGALFYDADGSGDSFSPIKFAAVTASTNLTAADFVVI